MNEREAILLITKEISKVIYDNTVRDNGYSPEHIDELEEARSILVAIANTNLFLPSNKPVDTHRSGLYDIVSEILDQHCEELKQEIGIYLEER